MEWKFCALISCWSAWSPSECSACCSTRSSAGSTAATIGWANEQLDGRMSTASPPTAKPLSLRGLAKHYATADGRVVEALLPIDLDIASGEFLVVVGPSGCGKSTMLNILAGLTQPSAGEARVGSAIVHGPDIDRGMVFQDYALFPWLDVISNVEFGLERKGVARRERRKVAMRYLEMVGLADFADKRPRELSGG